MFAVAFILLGACRVDANKSVDSLEFDTVLNTSLNQFDNLIDLAYKNDKIPRTVNEDGTIHWINPDFDWTEGFFPGSLWYLHSLTSDDKYKAAAEFFQNKYVGHRFLTTNHDLGFVFYNSYGLAYRFTKNDAFKQVLIDAGNSLIQRFNPEVGCIQSWDVDNGWQSRRGWKFPVIIDNMMNLELLFELTNITGDEKYKQVAIQHANTTLKNHFRNDGSCYHVVDYDPINGSVRLKQTAQGYAHESAWARGQAWAIYGYTMCYRYTKDESYLKIAEDVAQFYFNHPELPKDLVPYWDFNAPKIPNEPRDASAAAIIASALIELDGYTDKNYLEMSEKMLVSLSSDDYMAPVGENNSFILKHSVGSIPHNNEIDVPLNYADYYFIEALLRYKELKKKI